MYQRPKIGETDEDLLKLQEEFNKNKSQSDFQLASKLITGAKDKQSQILHVDSNDCNFEIQEHLDNTFEDIPKKLQIGSIIEKKHKINVVQFKHANTGFPLAKRHDTLHTIDKAYKGSIFAQQIKKLKSSSYNNSSILKKTTITDNINMQFEPSCSKAKELDIIDIKNDIHHENLDKINHMTEEEILEEKEKLMSTLDPAIVAFLKSRMHHHQPETCQATIAQQNRVDEDVKLEEIESAKLILNKPEATKWINFDLLEINKLAWMKNIKKTVKPKDGKYEARFDFDGWLLPFAHDEITEKTRILYHHGEEPERPGYTLQELFQLSRSNIIQQKVIALNTISAILSLHSSGIYDNVIEIPIEQIFFVLRFCLDDNTPALLHASIKAMRNLFHNQIDETCLDCLLGFAVGVIQPVLSIDEDPDDNTINDQQLAESNLVKCLVRSGILIRIRYIFNVVQPSEIETVTNCLDLLIRLARDSDVIVQQLWTFDGLLENVIKYFAPKVYKPVSSTTYGSPIIQAIKLLRILSSRSKNIAVALMEKYKILDSIATYLADELLSLNSVGLKLQIESLQLWDVLLYYGIGVDYFKVLRPVLWRLLDYHVKNTNIDSSWTIQTHIASILNLICRIVNKDVNSALEYLKLLFENGVPKWITQFGYISDYSCGKLQIVSSVFNLLNSIHVLQPENISVPWETIYQLVETLIASKAFKIVTKELTLTSNILNNYELHKSSTNLKCVESVAWNAADHIIPVLQTNSSIPLLNTLAKLVLNCKSNKLKLLFINNEYIQNYLKFLQHSTNLYMTSNWFTKVETSMIVALLMISVQIQKELDTALYYEVAVKVLCCFTPEHKSDVQYIFSNIIFCPNYYPSEVLIRNINFSDETILQIALSAINDIRKVYAEVLGLQDQPDFSMKLSLNAFLGNVLPLDWIYSPIIALYSNVHPSKVSESKQNVIISNCLRWIYVYETYFPDLASIINPTDKFCRLACTFLGSDTLFLIPEIQQLLRICLNQIITKHERELDFDKAIHGLKSFHDLYLQLLEQYQGVSYGDKNFGHYLLIPLAQRHNVKFRKALWSEYAGIIQIFNLTQEDLVEDIQVYLEPMEEDISLLKCYRKILCSGAIRKTSVLYKIATNHLEQYKNNLLMKKCDKMDTK